MNDTEKLETTKSSDVGTKKFISPMVDEVIIPPIQLNPVPDDRVKEVPWRWICSLTTKFDNNAIGFSTGVLVGPRIILTSGHTLLTHYPKHPVPGPRIRAISTIVRPCGSSRFFGDRTCSLDKHQILVSDKWQIQVDQNDDETENRANDYGVLILDAPFHAMPDFEFLQVLDDRSSNRNLDKVTIAGFIQNSPGLLTMEGAVSFDQLNPGTLKYELDTLEGMSGSPLLVFQNGIPYLLGLHSYGDLAIPQNRGTLITEAIAKDLNSILLL